MNHYLNFTLFISIIFLLPFNNLSLLLHDSSLPVTPKVLLPYGDPVKTVPKLIESWGYPVEEHYVTTEDGYTLTLHRIPGRNLNEVDPQKQKIPVLLGHCLVGTSAIWAFGPAENSLAFMLADQGYDVWLNNIRGNTYSKNHTTYDSCVSCGDFWEFSFDESARYDYPATIDYILQKTEHDQLYFIGYSMATTQYLILLSELPQYNAKIKAGFLLGPTAFGGNATNPLIPLSNHAETFQTVLNAFGIYEFLPNFLEIKSWLAFTICGTSPTYERLCRDFFSVFVGSHPEHLNASMAATYMSQMPAGASTKTFVHFAQLFRNGGRFTKYDYGTLSNLARYGSTVPPEYNLAKVTVPTVLFAGDADGFATPNDVFNLESHLTSANVKTLVVNKTNWSHLDFILSMEAGKLVYEPILQMIENMPTVP